MFCSFKKIGAVTAFRKALETSIFEKPLFSGLPNLFGPFAQISPLDFTMGQKVSAVAL